MFNTYTITTEFNKRPAILKITDYGATTISLIINDGEKDIDVLLGPAKAEDYPKQDKYFGAIVGRVANRIANASFVLDSKKYCLKANSENHLLHGGIDGFSNKIWKLESLKENSITLSYLSKNGENEFPGNLKVYVTYTLNASEDHLDFDIVYKASSDENTLCNLTWHGYFNLFGEAKNTLKGHYLKLEAKEFTDNGDQSYPNGDIKSVSDTCLDFTDFKDLDEVLNSGDNLLKAAKGLDHNFILHKESVGALKLAASLKNDNILLECFTTKPGIQIYSANFIEGEKGKSIVYKNQSGICLETQNWPNAINYSHFPSSILKANEEYNQQTRYRFKIIRK